jgi:sigma-B regulation protein RsbU (phosphoserine phosphatase)
MNILIAEDGVVSRRILQKTLEAWGHAVTVASDGLEALNLFRQGDFSMVITDWMMPYMDGLELVNAIRNLSLSKYVYIILLTAKSEKDDIVKGMEAGADDFIVKPFDMSELRVRLRAGERILTLEQNMARKNEELQAANAQVVANNQRMKKDLLAAAKIQQSMLPQTMPKRPNVNFAWTFQPCDELAGDTLNVFSLDENHVGLYVLDVSSHGIPAALMAVTVSWLLSPIMSQSSLLKFPSQESPGYAITPPTQVGARLNEQFQMTSQTGQYFTLLYGVLNTETCQFRYVQAGHPNPIYLSGRKNEAQILEGAGLPIGFVKEANYQEYQVNLKKSDRLVLYSDGVVEACNSEREQFGDERFMSLLRKTQKLPLKESLSQIVKSVREWSGPTGLADDVSLLALEIN